MTLECIGNVMKLTLESSLTSGRQLEVEVISKYSQVLSSTYRHRLQLRKNIYVLFIFRWITDRDFNTRPGCSVWLQRGV